jgi:hypothetical protein
VNQEQFAIVELMGHRRFGARIADCERFGAKFLHAEILTPAGEPIVQIVNPASIYALTVCTEAQARAQNTKWSLQTAVPMLPAEVPCQEMLTETCDACGNEAPAATVAIVNGQKLCEDCFEDPNVQPNECPVGDDMGSQ